MQEEPNEKRMEELILQLRTAISELQEEAQNLESCWKDEGGAQLTSRIFSALEDMQADVLAMEECCRKQAFQ